MCLWCVTVVCVVYGVSVVCDCCVVYGVSVVCDCCVCGVTSVSVVCAYCVGARADPLVPVDTSASCTHRVYGVQYVWCVV